jgi:hypothetical protein
MTPEFYNFKVAAFQDIINYHSGVSLENNNDRAINPCPHPLNVLVIGEYQETV